MNDIPNTGKNVGIQNALFVILNICPFVVEGYQRGLIKKIPEKISILNSNVFT